MKYILCLLAIANSYASVTGPLIVYGKDGRVEVERAQNPKIHALAKSVAVRVSKRILQKNSSNYEFRYAPTLDDTYGAAVCSSERFSKQPTVAECSGFLIDEYTLVTAGHCALASDGEVENTRTQACVKNYWVFDHMYENNSIDLTDVSKKTVYECDMVVKAVLNGVDDYAVIKLNKKVVDRKPLTLRSFGKVSSSAPIFVIGAPSGLPLKYAPGANVTTNYMDSYFTTNLDTFGGNSGSPVFNAKTFEVEGILVRGRTDYVEKELSGNACNVVNKCDQEGNNCTDPDANYDIDGEHVFRILSIKL